MLESRTERRSLGAAPDVAVVDICLNFLGLKTELLNHTSKKTSDSGTISAQEASFDFAWMIFFFATRPKSEARTWICIIVSLRVYDVDPLGLLYDFSQQVSSFVGFCHLSPRPAPPPPQSLSRTATAPQSAAQVEVAFPILCVRRDEHLSIGRPACRFFWPGLLPANVSFVCFTPAKRLAATS